MYYLLDKVSTEVYGFNCYVLAKDKSRNVTPQLRKAKRFKTRENAENFLKKVFTNPEDYDIIIM